MKQALNAAVDFCVARAHWIRTFARRRAQRQTSSSQQPRRGL